MKDAIIIIFYCHISKMIIYIHITTKKKMIWVHYTSKITKNPLSSTPNRYRKTHWFFLTWFIFEGFNKIATFSVSNRSGNIRLCIAKLLKKLYVISYIRTKNTRLKCLKSLTFHHLIFKIKHSFKAKENEKKYQQRLCQCCKQYVGESAI